MSDHGKVTLTFEGGFDEREAFEAQSRGYRSHVSAVLPGGERYGLVFYDPVRLQQDLEDANGDEAGYIGEPGLVVVQEVTLANMESAAAQLAREGFFDRMKPEETRLETGSDAGN